MLAEAVVAEAAAEELAQGSDPVAAARVESPAAEGQALAALVLVAAQAQPVSPAASGKAEEAARAPGVVWELGAFQEAARGVVGPEVGVQVRAVDAAAVAVGQVQAPGVDQAAVVALVSGAEVAQVWAAARVLAVAQARALVVALVPGAVEAGPVQVEAQA